MFENIPVLSIITFLPMLGALVVLLFAKKGRKAENFAKHIALWTTVIVFIASLYILIFFDDAAVGFQFVEKYEWIKGYNINYHIGVDGLSIYLVILTTFLMPICILAGWNSIDKQVCLYLASFLFMETMVIGSFIALDFVLFYLFFEAVLIPMFLIIGVWGGENRIYAAFKFFLYTLLGSVLLLVAIIYIYSQAGTADIQEIMKEAPKYATEVQKFLWLALFASFAVKVPMWPFHTWLPDAHVQAPTAGSVILAGVLLKLGGYGFLRFSVPMLPEASEYFAPFVFTLSIIAIIYTSLVALMQEDMKKLIAYSSVAHMGFVTIGIFTMNQQGVEGAIFQMISHGLVSGALFLCVGVVYDRMHTKEIAFYGGLVEKMPRYALMFMIFTMASIGLPGTSGFIGEFLVLVGAFGASKIVSALAATGVVLGAAYMLWLYRKVIFGEITNKKLLTIPDLSFREKVTLYPLAALVIFIGIYPSFVLDKMNVFVKSYIVSANFLHTEALPVEPENIEHEELIIDSFSEE